MQFFNFIKKNITFVILFFFVLLCFTYLYYLSLDYTINYWSFSQAHLNYSEGFVKRGLFGSIIIFLENKLLISTNKSFTYFFITIYTINIFLFFLNIYKYQSNKLLFLFFSLSPTLIMFSFNDLGGFQRFDSISIMLMLFHSYIIFLFRDKKIRLIKYIQLFNYIILPFIIISCFIHEIQVWSIPFHFLLNFMILSENKILTRMFWLKIFLLIFVVFFIFFYPINIQNVNKMIESLSEKRLWNDSIAVAARTKGNINIIPYELKTNLLNGYNFSINLFFTLMAVLPINFLIIKFSNKIKYPKNFLLYLNLSYIPFLSYFAIGDTGRWINLISFAALSFFSQFPYQNNNFKKVIKDKSNIKFMITLILIIIYVFFTRLPHCCNLKEKEITIWGGVYKKIEAGYNMFIIKNNNDHYNLNKRFKKQ